LRSRRADSTRAFEPPVKLRYQDQLPAVRNGQYYLH